MEDAVAPSWALSKSYSTVAQRKKEIAFAWPKIVFCILFEDKATRRDFTSHAATHS